MKKLLGIVLAALTFAGCASESENKAIHAIANHYGCQVSFSKGMAASTSEGSEKYIELTLRSSDFINSLPAEETASFSAFTLYQNLSQEEREQYSHVKTVIEQMTGNSKKTSEFEFAVDKLKMVENKLAKVRKIQDNLKQRQYEQMTKQVDPAAFKDVDKQAFYAQLDAIAKEFGEINDYEFRAFHFYDSEVNNEQKPLLEVKGLLLRSNKNLNFNVIFSPLPEDNQIYGFNFR